MAEPGELTGITLADIIVASGAAEAPVDEDRFYASLEEHKEHMPSEDELLRQRVQGPRVSFTVRPNESMGRPLVARLVEGDDSAESTIGRGREVTPEHPFVAQRYKNYHGKSKTGLEGGLEFAAGFRVVNDHTGVVEGLIRKNVVSVAIRNLGQVDITESRGGVIVAQWKNGELLIPGEGAEETAQEDAEPEPAAEPVAEPVAEEIPRERIELRPRPKRLERTAEPEQVIRFRKAKDGISEERAEGIATWISAAEERIAGSGRREKTVAYDQDGVTITNYVTTAETRGNDGDGIVLVAGVPARVSYRGEETIILYGDSDTSFGSYGPHRRSEKQGSVLTVVLNPESAEPEELKFDFEAADPVEEIARLAEGMTVDGEPVDPEKAERKVINLIADAGLALIGRR